MHVHYVHPLRKAFDFSLKLLRAAAACEGSLDEMCLAAVGFAIKLD